MSKNTKRILNWLITIFLILFILIKLPYGKIKDATNTLFNSIDEFIKNVGNVVSVQENSSFDHHIKNITFFIEDDKCYAAFEFYTINPLDVSIITINDEDYYVDSFSYQNNFLVVDVSDLICENNITPLSVSKIYTKNHKEHISTLTTIFHKEINYQIIEQKKQSVVGIRTQKSAFFNTSSTWGSGIILSKNTIIKSNWFSEYTMYEYLIVTNSHVVEKGNVYYVYNKNENDEYPKKTGLYKPNETVELLGHYTEDTDLAFLILTTYNDFLIPLDDEQFITNETVPIETNDTVFLIGSPFISDKPAFNSYKIGKIKETSAKIILADSDLCKTGCESIKTSAYLGEGSSGGGLFDINGNLIGINFAGSENHEEAFAIPIKIVIDAYLELLPQIQVKRSLATSFFLSKQLHNQFQRFYR